jgi:hypothetical protein
LAQNFCVILMDNLTGRDVLAPQRRIVHLAPRSLR